MPHSNLGQRRCLISISASDSIPWHRGSLAPTYWRQSRASSGERQRGRGSKSLDAEDLSKRNATTKSPQGAILAALA
jgi:hypothetical protein